MNYKKIYDDIIERAKLRKLTCYKERHHITPKCMGGTNDKNNIIELTAREHFICHKLLVLIYPENTKLKFALWQMINGCESKNQTRNYKISAKLYEQLKSEISLQRSFFWKEFYKNPENKEKRRLAVKAALNVPEVKEKLSLMNKIRCNTPEEKKKRSEWPKEYFSDPLNRQKASISQKKDTKT